MQRFFLWENDIPLFDPAYGDFKPYIDLYLPENGEDKNPCIVVIPGGGYGWVSVQDEGDKICRFLNAHGYAAAMLNYRIAPYKHPVYLLDAQRAIRLVRFHAADWNIDPEKIGTIGFSAGGHLCCMTAVCYDDGKPDGDEIDKASCRINTAAPCYAVTTLDKNVAHSDTRKNFLGGKDDEALAYAFSTENMLRDDMPPIFLWHTAADDVVPPECSLRLASALIKRRLPCELHIFPFGGHGLNLAAGTPLADQWPALYIRWLDHYNR
ncbi:MAG: alpha/beta hydrolase [Clostridia bacterium]|nr:alpha/beta hydrolase [Clostridia bacterium]